MIEDYQGKERRCITKEMVELIERIAIIEAKLSASENSLTIARESIDRRLEGMNEFREALRDSATKFVTRSEIDIKFDAIEKTRKDNIAIVVSILGIIISTIAFLIKLK